MRHLIVTTFLTLDGVYEEATPWQRDFTSEQTARFKREELFEAGAILLGRVTYDGFAGYWPHASDTGEFGERMNALPKYVATTTLDHLEWNNATVLGGDLVASVDALKQVDGGPILVYGSGTLAQSLLRHGLVDELRLMIFPLVLGSGRRLFGAGDRLRLNLASTRELGSGVLLLTYTPAERRPPDPLV
ncbi:dihydrofolate reductase family protein [Deinococcus pimensis]|uniref:dihydrofolate reductase family protein n=1 Tax=Deinococcus pimensis TaxID=309888 RepID=UPI00048981AA|nr:dihydrofolate reductase family protein [Deinococcus pimensis]